MIDFLIEQWWSLLLLYTILAIGNSYLAIVEIKAFETHGQQYIKFPIDAVGLSPNEQKTIKDVRRLTLQNTALALLFGILLAIVSRLLFGKQVFELYAGTFLLGLIYLNLRHVENILYYREMSKPGSVLGQIEYSRAFLQRASATSIFVQAFLLGIVALVTMRAFFWGGVGFCLVIGFQRFLQAKALEPSL